VSADIISVDMDDDDLYPSKTWHIKHAQSEIDYATRAIAEGWALERTRAERRFFIAYLKSRFRGYNYLRLRWLLRPSDPKELFYAFDGADSTFTWMREQGYTTLDIYAMFKPPANRIHPFDREYHRIWSAWRIDPPLYDQIKSSLRTDVRFDSFSRHCHIIDKARKMSSRKRRRTMQAGDSKMREPYDPYDDVPIRFLAQSVPRSVPEKGYYDVRLGYGAGGFLTSPGVTVADDLYYGSPAAPLRGSIMTTDRLSASSSAIFWVLNAVPQAVGATKRTNDRITLTQCDIRYNIKPATAAGSVPMIHGRILLLWDYNFNSPDFSSAIGTTAKPYPLSDILAASDSGYNACRSHLNLSNRRRFKVLAERKVFINKDGETSADAKQFEGQIFKPMWSKAMAKKGAKPYVTQFSEGKTAEESQSITSGALVLCMVLSHHSGTLSESLEFNLHSRIRFLE
jgi:hypothetical protein